MALFLWVQQMGRYSNAIDSKTSSADKKLTKIAAAECNAQLTRINAAESFYLKKLSDYCTCTKGTAQFVLSR